MTSRDYGYQCSCGYSTRYQPFEWLARLILVRHNANAHELSIRRDWFRLFLFVFVPVFAVTYVWRRSESFKRFWSKP